jgi:hypothetical protein
LETIGTSNELEAVANIIVRSREGLRRRCEETRLLKRSDPSMTEAMKVANIMPSGSSAEPFNGAAAAVLRAGVQKNTNKYIDPSKKQEARPRVRMRRSVSTVFRTDFAGTDEAVESIDW